MAGEYFDCVIFKETKNGKTFARQIGSAKRRDDNGFNVYLDALPPDGKFCIVPQRDRGTGAKAAPPRQHNENAAQNQFDDEIPF